MLPAHNTSAWRDRIPFTLLFGVATSIENLQAKLTRKAIRCIEGRRFDVVQAENALEQAFGVLRDEYNRLWLGAGLSFALLSRQRDHIQSLQALIDSVQVRKQASYTICTSTNALTVCLHDTLLRECS